MIAKEKFGYYDTKKEFIARYLHYNIIKLPANLYKISNNDIKKMKQIIKDFEIYESMRRIDNRLIRSISPLVWHTKVIGEDLILLFDKIQIKAIDSEKGFTVSFDDVIKLIACYYNDNDEYYTDHCISIRSLCEKI